MSDSTAPRRHLVVVDAYQGFLEHLTDEPAELASAAGLGLPLAEMCEALNCRVTLLDWARWYQYEERGDAFTWWIPFPAARPVDRPASPTEDPFAGVEAITRHPIPAQDPDFGRPFDEGLSPRTYGLLADSDPLFLASFVLNTCLENLHREDPIDAVILPMFGGCGYVAQMSRATGAGLRDVPFAVVVTGSSADRQCANGEGHWTRPAITRRQMETLSLSLADLAIEFGPCGAGRVSRGRSQGRSVRAPRRVKTEILEAVAAAADVRPVGTDTQFFLHEPKTGAAGALMLLDAARLLHANHDAPARPISCSGRNMRFPPNLPRDFDGYWSGRGWAKQLVADGFWRWEADRPSPNGQQAVRLYPSLFEHLPDIWSELAKGHAVLLSPEAAEGLAPGAGLPTLMVLDETPDPARLAERLRHLSQIGPAAIEAARQSLCHAVVAAHRGEARRRLLASTVSALSDLLDGRLEPPTLDSAALGLVDARLDRPVSRSTVAVARDDSPPTLCVSVSCYEMGDFVLETVESIWSSERLPDELLLVDDGSSGPETLDAIAQLERAASARRLPLTVIRQVNQGLASARNTALAATRCKFISFLDGDDLIDPRFYALAIDILEANPGLGGVAAWAETFGVDAPPGFWNAPQPELPLLLSENTVFVPCMSPVGLLRELGGYDVRQRYNYEDWELAIRLVAAGRPIVTIPRYLQRYRVRADSLFRTMSDVQNQVMREELFRNHRATVEKFGPELAAQIEHRLMRMAARQSQGETVIARGLKALGGEAGTRLLRKMASIGARARAFIPSVAGRK